MLSVQTRLDIACALPGGLRTVRDWALWCAERALRRERAAGREPDPRSWRVLDVAACYLQGQCGRAELDGAITAASNATAAAAAAAAARSAAWAAEDAARAAVRAAEDAAWTAAWVATEAAWEAAWAAEDAAREAAWEAATAILLAELELRLGPDYTAALVAAVLAEGGAM